MTYVLIFLFRSLYISLFLHLDLSLFYVLLLLYLTCKCILPVTILYRITILLSLLCITTWRAIYLQLLISYILTFDFIISSLCFIIHLFILFGLIRVTKDQFCVEWYCQYFEFYRIYSLEQVRELIVLCLALFYCASIFQRERYLFDFCKQTNQIMCRVPLLLPASVYWKYLVLLLFYVFWSCYSYLCVLIKVIDYVVLGIVIFDYVVHITLFVLKYDFYFIGICHNAESHLLCYVC